MCIRICSGKESKSSPCFCLRRDKEEGQLELMLVFGARDIEFDPLVLGEKRKDLDL